MGYNKYFWDTKPKEDETFGVLKISPIDEVKEQVFEVFISYGTGYRCDISETLPENVVPKALYLFDISYFRIERIPGPEGISPFDGFLVQTRRVVNRQIGLYGHTRYYLVKQLS